MESAFEAVDGVPPVGSALDQNGLRDGTLIIEDYLDHGEPVVALEHLIYMVGEPELPVSEATRHAIADAGRRWGLRSNSLDWISRSD
jgi:hypothetical protein